MSVGAVAAGPIDRSPRSVSRPAIRHAAALLAVGCAIALLELQILDLDHGTHLLVVLTLVMGVALLFGPGPATTALLAGGVVAAVASVLTVAGVFDTPHAYIQIATYLLAGGAFIVLASRTVRSRRRSAGPAAASITPLFAGQGPIEPLTARESEVLLLAASGITVEQIASRLFLSPNTVKTHLTHVYAKLGVRGRSGAIRAALHAGCLTPADICPHMFAHEPGESPVPVTADHRNG